MGNRTRSSSRAVKVVPLFLLYTVVVYLLELLAVGDNWFGVWALIGLPILVVVYAEAARSRGLRVTTRRVIICCVVAGIARLVTPFLLGRGDAPFLIAWIGAEVGVISAVLAQDLFRWPMFAVPAAVALSVEWGLWWPVFWSNGDLLEHRPNLMFGLLFGALVLGDLVRNLGQFWLACRLWGRAEPPSASAKQDAGRA